MFDWWRKTRNAAGSSGMPEIDSQTDLNELFRQDAVLLFKHSKSCPVSWAAHAHVMRFRAKYASVPVYIIPVIGERELSREIAARTGVRHESPQVILMRRGAVAESASHGAITESRLASMVEA